MDNNGMDGPSKILSSQHRVLSDCVQFPCFFPDNAHSLSILLFNINLITHKFFYNTDRHPIPISAIRWNSELAKAQQWYGEGFVGPESIISDGDDLVQEYDKNRAEIIELLRLCPDKNFFSHFNRDYMDHNNNNNNNNNHVDDGAQETADKDGKSEEEEQEFPKIKSMEDWEDILSNRLLIFSKVQDKLLSLFRQHTHPILCDGMSNLASYTSKVGWRSGCGTMVIQYDGWMAEVRLLSVARAALCLKMGLRICDGGILFISPIHPIPDGVLEQLRTATEFFREAESICAELHRTHRKWTPTVNNSNKIPYELLNDYYLGLQSMAIGLARRCQYIEHFVCVARKRWEFAQKNAEEFSSSSNQKNNEPGGGGGGSYSNIKLSGFGGSEVEILHQELATLDFITQENGMTELRFLVTAEQAFGAAYMKFGNSNLTPKAEPIMELARLMHTLHRAAIMRCLGCVMFKNPSYGLNVLAESLSDIALVVLKNIASVLCEQPAINNYIKKKNTGAVLDMEDNHYFADFKTQQLLQRQTAEAKARQEHQNSHPSKTKNREAESLLAEIIIRAEHLSSIHKAQFLLECHICTDTYESSLITGCPITAKSKRPATAASNSNGNDKSKQQQQKQQQGSLLLLADIPIPPSPVEESSESIGSDSGRSPNSRTKPSNNNNNNNNNQKSGGIKCYKCQAVVMLREYDECYTFRVISMAREYLTQRMRLTRKETECLQYGNTCSMSTEWQYLLSSFPLDFIIKTQIAIGGPVSYSLSPFVEVL